MRIGISKRPIPWPAASEWYVSPRYIILQLTEDAQDASQTLQQAQTTALLTLLNLNSATSTSPREVLGGLVIPNATPLAWRILVLDQHTKVFLATVLRVQDLRDVGITLHV